jgi:small-conductance mechanosensitive channel
MAVTFLSALQALWFAWADSQIEKVELYEYNELEYFPPIGRI